MYERDRFIAC